MARFCRRLKYAQGTYRRRAEESGGASVRIKNRGPVRRDGLAAAALSPVASGVGDGTRGHGDWDSAAASPPEFGPVSSVGESAETRRASTREGGGPVAGSSGMRSTAPSVEYPSAAAREERATNSASMLPVVRGWGGNALADGTQRGSDRAAPARAVLGVAKEPSPQRELIVATGEGQGLKNPFDSLLIAGSPCSKDAGTFAEAEGDDMFP